MIGSLILVALGTWNNSGWASNPESPIPKRASWASDPFERRTLPASLVRVDEPEPTGIAPHVDPKPEPEPTPPKAQPKPPAMPKAQPPTVYQLRDNSGKTWTHTDPRWLQTYVGQVNASLTPRYYFAAPVQYGYGSTCAGGACGR